MLDLFKKPSFTIVLSIVWGLGLAILLGGAIQNRNCIIVRSELPQTIENKVFQYPELENKCYQYKSYLSQCDFETHKKVKILS